MNKKPVKVLVVATSPPPYGGQAMMVQSMLDSQFEGIELLHVRMSFSSSMESMGRFQWKKVIHMIEVVWRATIKRFRYRTEMLYYVPGGSGKAPVLRDIFILFFLRLISPKVIFHFHAAGVSEVVESLPAILKTMAKRLYSSADLAIFLSSRNPDKSYFKPVRSLVIPNGLEDASPQYKPFERGEEKVNLLFVGVLMESKGVMVLLDAVRILSILKYNINVTIMGEFSSKSFKNKVERFVEEHNLSEMIRFTGVLIGEDKWEKFAKADIFCFPSFFESESFGNVIVEAMMFELPVIATDWRGIPDIVEDGVNGFVIPIRDSERLSEKIKVLIEDKILRTQLGKNGRTKYLENYRLEKFVSNLQTALKKIEHS